jgi:hypothetical protein
MQFFDLLAVQDLVSCLQEGRSHLRLQGLSHVQGGCMVVEPVCNVLQFSMQLQQLQNSWYKLDMGSNPQVCTSAPLLIMIFLCKIFCRLWTSPNVPKTKT